ncbi:MULTISPECIES: DUF1707 domain-containing protein [Actinoplanes]|uniref:DUF1707 SHOCT-like domain-containing protein n=1 Tax=Actinoplanes TaxID=1865 RepID=UPI0005F2D28B|nr:MULTISPECIES: DUF1707 domain-containing protein [Actinoplanes]GLY07429.1 hypothetical protein Acsp01_78080 [Actinoplanes sp. NBRC 101535]
MHPEAPVAPAATGGRIRTSDAEREQVAEILRAAMSEGRLDLSEGEERLATAYAARYRDELRSLTTDLPEGGRRALDMTPQGRAATRRDLIRHASFILVAAGVLTGLWLLSGATFFWPAIPLMFLVIGLFRHARHGRYRFRYSYAHHVRY